MFLSYVYGSMSLMQIISKLGKDLILQKKKQTCLVRNDSEKCAAHQSIGYRVHALFFMLMICHSRIDELLVEPVIAMAGYDSSMTTNGLMVSLEYAEVAPYFGERQNLPNY